MSVDNPLGKYGDPARDVKLEEQSLRYSLVVDDEDVIEGMSAEEATRLAVSIQAICDPLYCGLQMCERGNTLLIYNDGEVFKLNAWFHLHDDRWLDISYRSENYPSLNINVINSTKEKLAEHVNKTFGNDELWQVKRMNLPGVVVQDNHVVILDQ